MASENIDLQKSISYIKSVYMYLYTLIYIFISIKTYIESGVNNVHLFLSTFPKYVILYNKVLLYYNTFKNVSKEETMPLDKEMDNIVDIIKKLD